MHEISSACQTGSPQDLEKNSQLFTAIRTAHPPPRFLLGATLLFWGVATDHPIIGLLLALIVEAAHWTRLRWEFNDEATSRAWHITTIFTAITTVFIWLDGTPATAMPRLVVWLPPLLLPMQFVQSFGLRESLPLNTLSFFAKMRRAQNQKLGLEASVVHFNFGNAYFLTALCAATLGQNATRWIFLPGLLIFSGWYLLAQQRNNRGRLLLALGAALVMTLAGYVVLTKATEWLSHGRSQSSQKRKSFDPDFNKTAIGSMGELKLSTNVIWRIKPQPGTKPPKLVRTASYNNYVGVSWKNIPLPEDKIADTDFKDLATVELTQGEPYFLLGGAADTAAISPKLPRYEIRGAAAANTPLPMPGNSASLKDFDLDGIERNSLGTVRVFPKKAVISGTILWGAANSSDAAPRPADDLKIPDAEKATLTQIVNELGLRDLPSTAAKIEILQRWLGANFEYTRYLSIPRRSTNAKSATEISRFLTRTRKGHCEYFATAAALLLREAGVPTRYAIGYSLIERDPARGEFVIRGIHGHAWCRAWDESRATWVDFDATPPSWLTVENPRIPSTQWLTDGFQRFREDFFLWRNEPGNRLGAGIAMSLLALAILTFILRKLWRSKRRLAAISTAPAMGPMIRTPLHDLEKTASRQLGPRPPGLPFPVWLRRLSLPDPAQLEEAIRLHQRLRFDPSPPEPSILHRLSELVKLLQAATAKPS